jgi:hypothetical protein
VPNLSRFRDGLFRDGLEMVLVLEIVLDASDVNPR